MERRSGISIIKEQDQEKQKLRLASQLSRRSAAILELAKISQPEDLITSIFLREVFIFSNYDGSFSAHRIATIGPVTQ